MRHPYLNLIESGNGKYYSVGNSSSYTCGNGLTNKNGKIVQIPSVFNGKNVTEIAGRAFCQCKTITSVYISKNIKYIGILAFSECSNLSDIRFASDNQLTSLSYGAFYTCESLIKIDFPVSLVAVGDYVIHENKNLRCVSYLGIKDFSERLGWDRAPSEVKVSSNYPYSKFLSLTVTSYSGSTCGVSNLPFYKEEFKEKTCFVKIRKVPRLLMILIFVIVS